MVTQEEAVIRPCLESLSFADEIVVIDGFSTDRTREICREFGAIVVRRRFRSHVEQRDFSVALTRHPWVFCIDADERVTPELAAEIREWMSSVPDSVDGFSVPRLTVHLGRAIRQGGWYPDAKVRLARRSRLTVVGVTPHDRISVSGEVRPLKNPMIHLSYRDLAHHIEVVNRYTSAMARKRSEGGRGPTWWGLVTSAPFKFLKMFVLKAGFKEGTRGFILAVVGGFYAFLKHAKQWEDERLRDDLEPYRRDDSPFHQQSNDADDS